MAVGSLSKVSCIYCGEELQRLLYVKCASCEEFDLCLQCFASGAEIGHHKSDHPYQFINSGSVDTLPRSKWSTREAFELIVGVEKFGIGKWEEICSHCVRTRTAEEAKAEYFKHYLDGNVGNVTWKRAYDKRSQMADLMNDEATPLPIALFLPPLDLTPVDAASLGCMPRRDDFEKEYDSEAEKLLSPNLTDSTTNDTNNDLDMALTLIHCDMYTQRLRERYRRKRLCRDYHLISEFISSTRPKLPSRLTGEQEVEGKLRWLCQIQTPQEHDCLMKSIQRQRDLQQRVSELQRYRRNGLTRFKELSHFDLEFRSSKSSSRKKRRRRALLCHKKFHVSHRQPFIIAQLNARAAAEAASTGSSDFVPREAY